MSRYTVGMVLALICIALNIYILFKGKSETGMTAAQQARIKVVAGISLILAFIALTFGQYMGLE